MEPVSVVIPTYNRAQLIPHTLISVLKALEENDEIIVVDDGSTDDTPKIIEASDAPWHGRVKFLRENHGGAGRTQNTGIAAAKHDLIAFADSDDLWLPYRLELQRPIMESEPSLGFCFSNFGQLLPDGSIVPHWLVKWNGDDRNWDEILAPGKPYSERWKLPQSFPVADAGFRVHIGSMYLQLLREGYVNVNTLLVRRSVVGSALQFGVDLLRFNDWECSARIARVSECAYLDVDTALQRTHGGIRRTDSGPLIAAESRVTMIERVWASDSEFMQKHGEEVEKFLSDLKRTMVRRLILLNRREEARKLLPQLKGTWKERLALLMPRFVWKLFRRGTE